LVAMAKWHIDEFGIKLVNKKINQSINQSINQ
jgi:hypothetical protein